MSPSLILSLCQISTQKSCSQGGLFLDILSKSSTPHQPHANIFYIIFPAYFPFLALIPMQYTIYLTFICIVSSSMKAKFDFSFVSQYSPTACQFIRHPMNVHCLMNETMQALQRNVKHQCWCSYPITKGKLNKDQEAKKRGRVVLEEVLYECIVPKRILTEEGL